MALDPTLKQIVETVNGTVANNAIRHAVYLRSIENDVGLRINRFLKDDVVPDLLNKIEWRLERIARRKRLHISPADPGPWSTKRYKELTKATWNVMRTGMDNARQLLVGDLTELAIYEAEFTAAMLSKSVPIVLDFRTPPIPLLKKIVTWQPKDGESIKNAFKEVGRRSHKEVMRQLNIGLAEGESVPQLMRRLKGTRAMNYRDGVLTEKFPGHAEMVARTAANHVSNEAAMATYKENPDIVDRWKHVSTLDARTCPVCGSLDGQIFEMGKGPVPPQHPNCRCRAAPVVKVDEDDIDFEQVPGLIRASAQGEISAKTTWGSWIKKQDYEMQVEALGRGRADLLRSGRVSPEKFRIGNNKVRTVQELREIAK